MDGSSFDRLAREWAAGRTRRSVIRGLGAAALGALGLAGAGRGVAAATDCKGTGKTCSKGSQCCSGNCTPPPGKTAVAASGSICCPAGQVQYPTGTCCTPSTCAAQGKNCGQISDGCGGTLNCGTCTSPQTCGGGGTPHVCGCTPTTCAAQGATCGPIPDGCGGTLSCGSCTGACQTCGASHTCVAATDGTACDDGNACTTNDVCTGGVCGGTPVSDGTACGTGGQCDDSRCFLADPNCPGCFAVAANGGGANFCTSCDVDADCAGAACTETSDCPAGQWCAFIASCGDHCVVGYSA